MSGPLLPVASALSGGIREPVGWFHYDVLNDVWHWSAGLFEIHGFVPGEIVPTSALFAAHKHPEDRSHTDEVMAAVLATGQPYCCRHRIIDSQQRVRTVVTIGRGTLDESGEVTAVHGYFIDISDALKHATELEIRQALAESAASQADIEQAKGALMLVHGISAADAFAVLRWHSQHANMKLRAVAVLITSGISVPTTADESPAQRVGRLLGSVVPGFADGGRSKIYASQTVDPRSLTVAVPVRERTH